MNKCKSMLNRRKMWQMPFRCTSDTQARIAGNAKSPALCAMLALLLLFAGCQPTRPENSSASPRRDVTLEAVDINDSVLPAIEQGPLTISGAAQ